MKHSRAGHGQRVSIDLFTASKFRAAARFEPFTAGGPEARERDLLRSCDKRFLLMKKLMLLGALGLFATSIGAQSIVSDDPKRLEAVLKEVQAQQIVIAENQAKIDAKLVTLGELIRVARIYSSRGGR